MNLKLEELRKRLLEPSAATSPSGETIYRSSAGGSSPEPAYVAQAPGVIESSSESMQETQNAAQPDTLTSSVLEYVGDQVDLAGAKSQYQLAQAVAKVFEPTRVYQDRLAEIAKSFESIQEMTQSANRAFEPIKAFREQMLKLSKTFEPMRSFREQLGTLAQSFEPMQALHHQMVQLAEAFEVNLAQFAHALEPARDFQAQLEKLKQTFESATELQGQFMELSEAFRVASRGERAKAPEARN